MKAASQITRSYQYSAYLTLKAEAERSALIARCIERLPEKVTITDREGISGILNAMLTAPLEKLQIEKRAYEL